MQVREGQRVAAALAPECFWEGHDVIDILSLASAGQKQLSIEKLGFRVSSLSAQSVFSGNAFPRQSPPASTRLT
jgi:hypothetical protein